MLNRMEALASWAVVLTLGLLVSCEASQGTDEEPTGPSGLGSNYGEDRIGYKDGKLSRERAAEQGAVPPVEGGDEAVGESDGDGWGGDGDGDGDGEDVPLDAGVVVDGGGPDAGVDAGTDGGVDAGADAGADAPAVTLRDEQPAIAENPFFSAASEATSTFALDVDTGSYTLARGAINAGHLPAPSSVRIEEFLNYFHFHYKQPEGTLPFAEYVELAACPWNDARKLLMLGVQGQEVELVDQPPANLVFLLDVSGSMSDPNKLPLLKKGFRMLSGQLRPQDRVSIVTYAGTESVVLEGAHGDDYETIVAAIDGLESGGSTNGEGGIQRAYQIALANAVEGTNNRVLLATDGDFNVGISDPQELVEFISQKRGQGVFLSVYGFGDAWDGGNYEDETMEQLADNGDGIYFYIDSAEEARRAFLSTVSGSLLTVAKDVKIQVEFNPAQVKGYRLIGYENRVLANDDFDDDNVDGGELGAGLSMTALYEIIPAGSSEAVPRDLLGTAPLLEPAEEPSDDGTEVPTAEPKSAPIQAEELVQVRIRYKASNSSISELIEHNYGTDIQRTEPSPKLSFAAAVSELAIQLRGSQYKAGRPAEALSALAARAEPLDAEGAVAEFLSLLAKTGQLSAP